jgi:alpha-N-arabinofuranosidase
MKRITIILLFATVFVLSHAQNTLVVNPGKPVCPVQPTMWGIFFEDINFAADGGLYAELVKNRSFEFSTPLMGWRAGRGGDPGGDILVINRQSNSNNPHIARVTVSSAGKPFLLTNEGFRGMGIQKNETYHFSLLAKQNSGHTSLRVELVRPNGDKISNTAKIPLTSAGWQSYKASFSATDTAMRAQLNIYFEGPGVADVDMISLFPQHTWKGRSNGMRADLVQLLADMKPGFLRFPGGCIVEGRELSNRYQWKTSVGTIDQRKTIMNRWNVEFAHRPTPDYFQSFGLGFYEYFLLAEDIGAEPLPILNCGMACQFNTAEVAPVEELDPYLQDALDLIEFANGATTTKWGGLRAKMGHPKPFNLKMMGVGNEQWGPQYIERYRFFTNAIKKKYPAIQLVNSTGTDPDGAKFNFLNDTLRKLKADILDEHYYRAPEWFLQNAARYDNYDRAGPKIFAGEYAAQSRAIASKDNKNNWQCALAEAAFMTGLERNAGVVYMASYAPLFAHADAWQWTPDLIWFDNLRSYGTADYYVQKLFSNYKGAAVVPALVNGAAASGKDNFYASAVVDKTKKTLILKLVNTGNREVMRDIAVEGTTIKPQTARHIVLQNSDPSATNAFEALAVQPEEKALQLKDSKISVNLKPYSFNILVVEL